MSLTIFSGPKSSGRKGQGHTRGMAHNIERMNFLRHIKMESRPAALSNQTPSGLAQFAPFFQQDVFQIQSKVSWEAVPSPSTLTATVNSSTLKSLWWALFFTGKTHVSLRHSRVRQKIFFPFLSLRIMLGVLASNTRQEKEMKMHLDHEKHQYSQNIQSVLVLEGFCNKFPYIEWLINNRNLFLTVLEPGSPRRRPQQMQNLARDCPFTVPSCGRRGLFS